MSRMEANSWIVKDVEDLFHRADALWQVVSIQAMEDMQVVKEPAWISLVESMQDYKELRVGMEQDNYKSMLALLKALTDFITQAMTYVESEDLQENITICHRQTLEQIKNILK